VATFFLAFPYFYYRLLFAVALGVLYWREVFKDWRVVFTCWRW
jgi:hypothetical protein